jgi:hypothetical protein
MADPLMAVLDRTSAAITMVGPPDDVLWRFARCWLTVVRLDLSEQKSDGDKASARSDLAALPADLPGRAALAAELDKATPMPRRPSKPRYVVANPPGSPRPGITAAELLQRARTLQERVLRGGLTNMGAVMAEFQQLMVEIDRLPPDDQLGRALGGVRQMMAGYASPAGNLSPEEVAHHQTVTAGALFQAGTPEAHQSSVDMLDDLVARVSPDDPLMPYYLLTAGTTRLGPPQAPPGQADIIAGISLLERAKDAAGSPVHPCWTVCALSLSKAYQLTGRPELSRRVALAGLDGHAWSMLLASDSSDATSMARETAANAHDVAMSCVAAKDLENAIHAWEIGNAAQVYASVETQFTDARLRALGQARLARMWTETVSSASRAQVPAALRTEVLTALIGTPIPTSGRFSAIGQSGPIRLLEPPTLPEIRAALTALQLDVLVYLTSDGSNGHVAVIVPVDEPPYQLALSTRAPMPYTSGKVDFAITGQWAWQAVMGKLIAHLPSGRPVRMALIPLGDLAAIPWHAACHRTDGGWKYAIEEAVFTYPASARMLCDFAWRGSESPSEPVICDPDEAADLARKPGAMPSFVAVTSCPSTGWSGPFGIDTTLLAAGVRSVVSPRWPVSDAAFVHRLDHSQAPADALREVQLSMAGTADPRSWAAFVHSGR